MMGIIYHVQKGFYSPVVCRFNGIQWLPNICGGRLAVLNEPHGFAAFGFSVARVGCLTV